MRILRGVFLEGDEIEVGHSGTMVGEEIHLAGITPGGHSSQVNLKKLNLVLSPLF